MTLTFSGGLRCLWFVGFVLALTTVICGSLVPFRFQPLDFGLAVDRFVEALRSTVIPASRLDWVANLLVFMPVSYCLMGAIALDRRQRGLSMPCLVAVLLASATSSVAIEFSQVWVPGRCPSASDVIAQTIGAGLGIGLWLLTGRVVMATRKGTGGRGG